MDEIHSLSSQLTLLFFDHDHHWLHVIIHLILVVTPLTLLMLAVTYIYRVINRELVERKNRSSNSKVCSLNLPGRITLFIKKYTYKKQIYIALGALLILPVTYATLELPKQIINNALDGDSYDQSTTFLSLSQINFLFFLCGLYLISLAVNGGLKFILNFYKGSISEGLIKRLRLMIFSLHRRSDKDKRSEHLAPVILQEVEPICAFSGDSVAVPLIQGGTVFTIITFMLLQNVALGAAVIALLPVQLIVIPIFQRRINALVYERLQEVRVLNEQIVKEKDNKINAGQRLIRLSFNKLYFLRLKLFKTKFIMKSLNNFIMNLTPFFFYTVGGYLVIEGKLSLGALVASLASYKDLASAIRELFKYYQTLQDARTRYSAMINYTRSIETPF
ncbi:hypothetical protein [Aliamphritea ceti]|uniref:hypothetical protein n=1 Tax=Aliamphritea ceti TaxID=1524258 RepID=UPI0021C2FE2B|nr:hypothetical protein [Aliamphritea ceti]